MYIQGEWCDAEDKGTYQDLNPYTGEVFATVPRGRQADVKRAVDAAQQAFKGWSDTLPAVKQALFLKAATILESKQEEIVGIIADETGGTFGWGMFQTGFTPGLLREAASQVHQPIGEILPSNLPDSTHMAVRQPVGVVAGISPWNAPLILSLRAICLPIAYGNTVVLKPAMESAVAGGLVLARVFDEAGFPPGVLNVVTNGPGGSSEVGDELIENPLVRRINFTGSTQVGRHLAEKAGRNLKRIAMELGGHNPLLVLKDCDLEYAVNAAVFGAFLHQGQICMSVRRIIVEQPVMAEFLERFVQKVKTLTVGNPREPQTIIGPLINGEQLKAVEDHVEDAVSKGAIVLCGGKSQGPCFQPTVLTGVTSGMQMSCEETFGPVVAVLEAADVDAAVKMANDTPYGLSAGIMTSDHSKGWDIAGRIESGIVHINDQSVHDEPQVPFGGIKDSGWGRMGGRAAIEEFTELRWISIQRKPRSYPF
jgi:aldehyde dehydrogenase (NAD+)